MHLLEMLGQRKKTATEPPFSGQVLELDGSPADLSSASDVVFRLGTPGQTPLIDKPVNLTEPTTGKWEYRPTVAEAEALIIGVTLVHIVITWTANIVEPVPFDHYFQLEILEML